MSKCCDGYTYRCEECHQKFCLDCQRSNFYQGAQLCQDCYYRERAYDADDLEDQQSKIEELEKELETARDELRRNYHQGRESAFREMKTQLESTAEPLDKAALLGQLDTLIDRTQDQACCIQ